MNRIRDEIRKRQTAHAQVAIDSGIADPEPSPLEQAIGQQTVERYERALGRLREEDQDVLIGRLELGLTYRELADVGGRPSADAARKAAQRALVRLIQEMRRDG